MVIEEQKGTQTVEPRSGDRSTGGQVTDIIADRWM
jgi:hypothetical protein